MDLEWAHSCTISWIGKAPSSLFIQPGTFKAEAEINVEDSSGE